MPAFEPLTVSYLENRADGGFAWNVGYDLSFLNNVIEIDLRVQLTGDDPGAVVSIWQDGISSTWNQKVFFADADRLYEVKLDFDFVSSDAHQVVTVHSGSGPCDMLNWYTSYAPELDDEFAAHEVGHMLGNFDEYAGGATHDHFTRTGALMSDLTLAGFQDYFSGVEQYTEIYGDMSLATVLALVGTAESDALDGTSAMDGFYGLDGNDTIDGLAGNDYLDGGPLDDVLRGGSGDYDDILIGGSGSDTLEGGLGDDVMNGCSGIDTASYQSGWSSGVSVRLGVTEAQDTRGAGMDTLLSIEQLAGSSYSDNLAGNGVANLLTGWDGNDLLNGRGDNDRLVGGRGQDSLVGGAGRDEFVFNAALNGGGNADRIIDFSAADDRMTLDEDIFTALAVGALPAAAFGSGAGVAAARDSSDRILYNTTDGNLYYDPDGSGGLASKLFGTLAGTPGITAADFLVVA